MWHTHRARECKLTTESEKKYAKETASVSGLNNITKDELNQMSIKRLKRILKNEILRNKLFNNLNEKQINLYYNYTKFIEKIEFVNAVYHIIHSNLNNDNNNENNNETDWELFPKTKDEIMKKSVKNCKLYLKYYYNIDLKDSKYKSIILEKSDLVNLILKLQKENPNPKKKKSNLNQK